VRLPTLLVVQHTPNESVGRLGDWLLDGGVLTDVCTPYDGQPLPALDGYAGMLVLGGPMSAVDDEIAAWLPPTREQLRNAVGAGLPVLGICLGAQLLAVALGGRVQRGAVGPEIGPGLVAKRDIAASDPLFRPVPFTPDVVHWHWDEITELPPGATLLASSTRYLHQAYRVGERGWGLQFHLETTPDMVRQWADEDAEPLAGVGIDVRALAAGWDLDLVHDEMAAVWQPFARRFVEVIRQHDYARQAG
jgi:GMP synthase (glutamine-hydrolysing)